jgi:hypothetical protein
MVASHLKLAAAPHGHTMISRSYRGSFDSAPARPAKEAGRKFSAGAPLRMTSHIHE